MPFDDRIRLIASQGDAAFTKRAQVHSLWQTIAENFCPQLASFTREVDAGDEFASNLTTSYPLMVTNEFTSQLSAMTRPRDIQWARMGVDDEESLSRDSMAWLEWASGLQRRAMYYRGSQFVRATKQADMGFGVFGQWPLTVEWDWRKNGLLYRSWHLKDVAWSEGYDGQIARVDHNWNPTAQTLARMFPGKIHREVEKLATKEPTREVKCRRVMLLSEDFDSPAVKNRKTFKWVSLFLDLENQVLLEETPQRTGIYVIPRWCTLPSSPYAYSPCTTIALPDSRLLQAITLTLLEGGEMAVRPPMIAVGDAIRSDLNLFAGGVTKVDAAYDERLGEVLRPISQDKSGLPFGAEMSQGVREQLAQAFFLNKLTLPPSTKEMTAFETAQRIQEYIRAALPLFEPLEDEYNGALCEETFTLLKSKGVFNRMSIPRELANREVEWKFVSPLHDAIERKLSGAFQETTALLTNVAQIDPTLLNEVNLQVAFRDALRGVGAPFRWRRSEAEIKELSAQQQQQQEDAQTLDQLRQAAEATKNVGQGAAAMQAAGGM